MLDGVVSDEKLAELLALGTEYPELDFKSVIDLTDKKQEVELARDVGGMLVRGGYILVGVGQDGHPSGQLDGMDLKLFDDARLAPKLRKWLPAPLSLVTRVAERDGHKVVLIYIERSPSGMAFMIADGTYEKSAPDKTIEFAFRKGDAFWRDGSRTERLSNEGHEEIIQRRIEDAKSAWMAEQREMRRREQAEATGAASASRQLGAVSLDLEQPELNVAALELARQSDSIAFEFLLNEALTRARSQLNHSDVGAEFSDLLDRLICLAAALMHYGLDDWFKLVIDALSRIYAMPAKPVDVEQYEYSTQIAPSEVAPRVWLEIVERVYALGGLAVREGRWQSIRCLTLQPAAGTVDYHKNWLRQALTTAARAQHLREERDGRQIELSLLTLARTDAVRLECLRADGVGSDDDVILTAIAQFDVLYNVVAIDDAGETGGGVYFTNFARFHGHRVTPVIERLIADEGMRQDLLEHGDDANLSVALQAIGTQAQQVGSQYDGFTRWSPAIEDFINWNRPR